MATLHIPEQLKKARAEAAELERRLADLKVFGEEWERINAAIAEMEELRQTEDDLREELDEELAEDRRRLDELERKFRLLLAPPDPTDVKNAIVEIRAGTGGDESTLFASDLFRMYGRFAEKKGFKVAGSSS